jgi:hypothetical protein
MSTALERFSFELQSKPLIEFMLSDPVIHDTSFQVCTHQRVSTTYFRCLLHVSTTPLHHAARTHDL